MASIANYKIKNTDLSELIIKITVPKIVLYRIKIGSWLILMGTKIAGFGYEESRE